MKRTFTKYPSGYVSASSVDAGLSRRDAAKSKSNKELLDQYALLVATGSDDEQAKEILYDEILSRMG